MSKKDYVPIGEIMTRKNGKRYEVKSLTREDFGCADCAFVAKINFCNHIPCTPESRRDMHDVYYTRRKDLES